MKTTDETFIENVRRELRRQGLTQVKLAKEAKITESYISQVFKGKRLPGRSFKTSISNALGKSVAELERTPASAPPTKEAHAFAAAILSGDTSHLPDTVSDESRRAFEAFLKTL